MNRFSSSKKLLTCVSVLGLMLAAGGANAAENTGETINITDVPTANVYGNSSTPDGYSFDLAPADNTININLSNKNFGDFDIYGANSMDTDVTGNTVVINAVNSTGFDTVSGGAAGGTNSANNNRVVIHGGADYQHIFGGASIGGDANNNSVTIKSGTFTNTNIAGGHTEGAKDANGNMVIITGGLYTDSIIFAGMTSGGTANDNIVSITGTASLDNVALSGGSAGGTGNILNIGIKNAKVAEISGFNDINFYLPANTKNGDKILNATNDIDIDGVTVTVGVQGARSVLTGGDKIILIDTDTNALTGTLTSMTGVGMSGLTLKYDFDLEQTANQLIATILGNTASVQPQTKVFSEGRAALLASTSQGADLLAGGGIRSAMEAADRGNAVFGTVAGGYSKYKTGSSVSLYGASGMAGFAKKFDTRDSRIVLAAFAEFGGYSYETENDFSGTTINADGMNMYYGGGVLLRTGLDTGGYLELAGRVGMSDGDFSSDDMGIDAKYDSSALYYGGHVGFGYAQMLGTWKLDAYAKWLYTVQTSDDVELDSGEIMNFDDAKSSRIMAGARLIKNSFYGGAAYVHEFNGDIDAKTSGLIVDTPSLEGGSAMLELGYAKTTGTWTFDIGVNGYFGERTGAGATGSIRYKF